MISDEACEGEEEEENPEEDDRPGEGADALVVGFGSEPDAGDDYWD